MTEKIIIDGVNVTGCCRFEVEQGEPNNTSHTCDLGGTCDGWENCYYKQLQRLKQENGNLKVALEKIREICKITFVVCDDDCGNANKIVDIIDKINKVLESEEK